MNTFISMTHDAAGQYPTLSTDYGTCTNERSALQWARQVASETGHFVHLFHGEDVVITYDDGTFCGTDLDAATFARQISPGGRVRIIHM